MSAGGTPSPLRRLESLSAGALIGTDRSGAGKDAPAKLLTQAALLGAQRRAGLAPIAGAKPVPACPEDATPQAAVGAAAILSRLLAEPDATIIEQWAQLAVTARRRVPDALAPPLLEWWARQPRRSPAVFHALGTRGEWLASLNPDWRKPVAGDVVPPNLDDRWQTGTAAERVALLTTVRSAAPERAVPLLESTWKADSADERRKFVEQLGTALSMKDEPFLETALDDRSKLTREAAAALLARLPESRFVARMTALARAMIKIEPAKKGLIKKSAAKAAIEPPPEFEKAWERDAIEEKPPGGVGKRAWWLRQILARTPPSALVGEHAVSPAEFLAAVSETDYSKDALIALSESCVACADPDWCAAMLQHRLDKKSGHSMELAPLWRALDPARREKAVLGILPHDNLSWKEHWAILGTCEHEWTPSFSSQACEFLKKNPPKKSIEWYDIGDAVDAMSRRVHPAAAGAYEEAINAAFRDKVPPSVTKSLDRVRLRAEMLKEFTTQGPAQRHQES